MLYCKWIATRMPLCRFTMVILVVLLMSFMAREVRAEIATMDEARQVCQNWLKYMVSQRGNWAGDISPKITGSYEIVDNDTLLGYYFTISPSGYIVVPILKELPPIKAYSEKYSLDIEQTQGIPALLKEVLHNRIRLYAKIYGSLNVNQPSTGDVLLGRGHKAAWGKFLKSAKGFETDLIRGTIPSLQEVGPLLTTSWCQRSPYNNLCPTGEGGDRCVVGCVATAAAQIMKYWHWPPYGSGTHSYEWDGDDSCDSTHAIGAGTELDAVFWDLYDWRNMPDSCDLGCTTEQEDAVAEICYEIGVAVEMDYGVCGSEVPTYEMLNVYPTYFRYSSEIDREDRADDYSAAGWFQLIKNEINSLRPIQYRVSGHSIVCDGWRVAGGLNQYHMNYGWGNARTTWYTIDSLYCSWESDSLCPYVEEYLLRYIEPDNQICGTIYDGDGGPLTETGGPYYVRCHLEVPSKKTLTIEQSVWLVFRSGKKLVAWGTATASGNNIHFESPNSWMDLNATFRLKNGGYIKLQ